MLVYWVGEAIPIPATALLGPVLCVLLGIAEPANVLAPFAHPIVFLFIGSFILAEGMIVHRLNERIALSVLSIRWLLARPRRLAIAVGTIPELLALDHPWIQEYFNGPRGRAALDSKERAKAMDNSDKTGA